MTPRFYNDPFVRQVMVLIVIAITYVLFPTPMRDIRWIINGNYMWGLWLGSIPMAYAGSLIVERIVRFIFEVTKPYKHFIVQLIASMILAMVMKLYYLVWMTS